MDKETLSKLDKLYRETPTYYEVRCTRCQYSAPTFLWDEADLRAQVHEHECGHACEILEVALVNGVPDELGASTFDKCDNQN